ncbi:DNA-binding response regulator (plasmid) [Sarcina sp. JB2]|uniref:DNA-binding response regulator n=1 Tax=Candidatus Sarcina troglodytae TaxID=2726954 RepID=A0ACD1BGW1_9CLOT|nr:DNA-binding response regulator [Sarcina sp. JB2]QPJ86701.1 DNA-binding response regulator [Sarcina sp. JB2]
MVLALKQEDEKELSQSVKYINIVHRNSDGWITKAKISAEGYKQWHYKHMQLVKLKFDKDNVYITLNTFYKTYRRIEYLKELNALFIDLDTYKTDFTKEQILMNLNENYFGKNIPTPNFIIDSGRGLYLIWLIRKVPSMALPLWKAVEEYFYRSLKEFGADRQALDATRILRIPGSINSKTHTEVKIIDNYDYLYDLREIQNEYMPELSEKAPIRRGRPKKVKYIYRERSLYYARIQDLIKLCELREYNLKGHRELVLFLYRYYLCYFTEDIEKSLNDTLELNNMFKQPLREKEVLSATKSAETVFKDQNKDYKYKNETLINLLEISDEEQKEMKTIISKEEYKRRDREYQKKKYKEELETQGKLTAEKKILQRRIKIKDLLAKGLKQKEIYLQLNISKRTCINDIKFLREQGLI